MKYQNKRMTITLMFVILFIFSTSALAKSADHMKIKNVIQTYEKALNGSDVKAVLSVYADDGVFMPSQKPTAVGRDQIKVAYQHVFKALDLNVTFHYDKIEQDGKIAYVRTTSMGDIKLLEKEITVKNDVHRELFVLKNQSGKWKIAQYMFNKPQSQ